MMPHLIICLGILGMPILLITLHGILRRRRLRVSNRLGWCLNWRCRGKVLLLHKLHGPSMSSSRIHLPSSLNWMLCLAPLLILLVLPRKRLTRITLAPMHLSAHLISWVLLFLRNMPRGTPSVSRMPKEPRTGISVNFINIVHLTPISSSIYRQLWLWNCLCWSMSSRRHLNLSRLIRTSHLVPFSNTSFRH